MSGTRLYLGVASLLVLIHLVSLGEASVFDARQSSSFSVLRDRVIVFPTQREYMRESKRAIHEVSPATDKIGVPGAGADMMFGFAQQSQFGQFSPDRTVTGILGFGPESHTTPIHPFPQAVASANRNIDPRFTIAFTRTGGLIRLGAPLQALYDGGQLWTELKDDAEGWAAGVTDIQVDGKSIMTLSKPTGSAPALLDTGRPCVALPNNPSPGVNNSLWSDYQDYLTGAQPPKTLTLTFEKVNGSVVLPLAEMCVKPSADNRIGLGASFFRNIVAEFNLVSKPPGVGFAKQNVTAIGQAIPGVHDMSVNIPVFPNQDSSYYTVETLIGTPKQIVRLVVDTTFPMVLVVGNFQVNTPTFAFIVVFFALALFAGSVILVVRQRRRLRRMQGGPGLLGDRHDLDYDSDDEIAGYRNQGAMLAFIRGARRNRPPRHEPAPFHQVILPPRNVRQAPGSPAAIATTTVAQQPDGTLATAVLVSSPRPKPSPQPPQLPQGDGAGEERDFENGSPGDDGNELVTIAPPPGPRDENGTAGSNGNTAGGNGSAIIAGRSSSPELNEDDDGAALLR